ncbi:MAG: glutaminyl-peptide cyclotransferase [Flavobacteriales bacterium]
MKFKIHQLIFILLIFSTLMSCEKENSKRKKSLRWSLKMQQTEVKETTDVRVMLNLFGAEVEDLKLLVDKKEMAFEKAEQILSFSSSNLALGAHKLEVFVTSSGKTYKKHTKFLLLSAQAPEMYTYQILKTYPHNPKSFTQGLEFEGDKLYEGTGRHGESKLMQVDLETGKTLKSVDLPQHIFGEGISILTNQVYQLTWQARTAYVYDLESFEAKNTFTYGQSREGWGLCNDGQYLYKSDGTSRIYKLNAETFTEISSFEIVSDQYIYQLINELEWIDGKIYANVYGLKQILIIEPNSGRVEGIIDLKTLNTATDFNTEQEDVLNGIACQGVENEMFVTGKLWDKLYKIKLIKN